MKFLFVVALAIAPALSNAACSDSEYVKYQGYDKFLDDNPAVPAQSLRIVYAKRIGMPPAALKDLHVRCSARWAQSDREGVSTYLKSENQKMINDCKRRPKDDPICGSFRNQ